MLVEAAHARLVKLRRGLHAKRLVRAVVIIIMAPALKAALLRGEIGGGRAGNLGLQVAVHALVRAVLLGRGRVHELDLDALVYPPDAQARQPAQPIGGERAAKVAANNLRQPGLSHEFLESAQRVFILLVWLRAAREDVMTITITYSERVATLGVAEVEAALEVNRPDVIGLRWHGQAVVEGAIRPGIAPAWRAHGVASQNLADGAVRGRVFDAVLELQEHLQLPRPPSAMQAPFGEDELLNINIGAMRAGVRPVATRLQALEAIERVAGQVFIAGLAADAELLAQIAEYKAVCLSE